MLQKRSVAEPCTDVRHLQIFRTITGDQLLPLSGWFDKRHTFWSPQGLDDQIDNAMTLMTHTLGKPPQTLRSAWGRWDQFFDADGKEKASEANWNALAEMYSPQEADAIQALAARNLDQILEDKKPPGTSQQDLVELGILLRAMLQYNPEDRTSAEKLLGFRWFTKT